MDNVLHYIQNIRYVYIINKKHIAHSIHKQKSKHQKTAGAVYPASIAA